MCEKRCSSCANVRFVKPEENRRSFCIEKEEALLVIANVTKSGVSQTHKEPVESCDHPELFQYLDSHPGTFFGSMGGPLFQPKEKG